MPSAAAADGGSGSDGHDPPPPPPPAPARREVLLHSFASWAVLGNILAPEFWQSEGTDGRTIVNSVLGAYGLPQMRAAKGYKLYDNGLDPYVFQYPKAWVSRKNSLRPGIVISDFNTADQLKVEEFPEPPAGTSLAEAAVLKLINPAAEVGGDSRLELPAAKRIKMDQREIEGKVYTYLSFPSETTTRSGYQVRRKNRAVVACRRGTAYVLGCSARSDQFNAEKEETFQQIVDSFRLP